MAADNSTSTILWRAMVVLLLAYPVGWVVGAIAQSAVQSHVDAYKKAHPIPDDGVDIVEDDPTPTSGPDAVTSDRTSPAEPSGVRG